MWSRALPNAASKKVTSDAGSDGLDALLAECALERSSSTSARSPARAPARPATVVPPPPPQQQQRVLTSDECRARDAVVALQQALADAAIAAAVDRTLKSAGAVDTWRYYDDRPELARYTIERELARNTFVVTEDGVEVTDAAARLGRWRATTRTCCASRTSRCSATASWRSVPRSTRAARRRPSRTPPARRTTSRSAARRASRAACASPSTCRRRRSRAASRWRRSTSS